jgi:hypothetical protein
VLLREVEARTAPTILAVRTTPPGAQVEIDGRIVGESNAQKPLEYRVYAGAHRIVVQLRGYETAIRSVQVVAGETKPIEVDLVPVPGTSWPAVTTVPHRHRTRWGAWLTLGAGAVVASTGIALIVADQDAPRSPDVTQPYDRRETMTLGIATAGLGAAAIGAGLWWLRRTSGAPRGNATTAPAVRVAPSSVMLLYSGAF